MSEAESKSVIKDHKEVEKCPAKTLREITRGKKISLPKSYKRIAAGILDKKDRRTYINSMLDAIVTETTWKMTRRKDIAKETTSE